MANEELYHLYMDEEMFSKLKPKSKHVIIQIKDDRKQHNGIYLAKVSPVIPDKGSVVKVADDLKEEDIKVGSKAIFERYVGRKIFTEKETYLILHEDYILALLPDDADVGIKYDGILK